MRGGTYGLFGVSIFLIFEDGVDPKLQFMFLCLRQCPNQFKLCLKIAKGSLKRDGRKFEGLGNDGEFGALGEVLVV